MHSVLLRTLKEAVTALRRDAIEDWAVESRALSVVGPCLTSLLKHYLTLACATSVTSARRARNQYGLALREVTYVSMMMLAKGQENAAYVLLRQSIELALKNVYFATHPIEYDWTQVREGYREVTYQFLSEYMRKLDIADIISSSRHDSLQRLDFWYGLCSRHVHVHGRRFLSIASKPYRHKVTPQAARRYTNAAREVWQTLAMVLVLSFPTKFISASEAEKRVILHGLTPSQRRAIAKHQRKLALG